MVIENPLEKIEEKLWGGRLPFKVRCHRFNVLSVEERRDEIHPTLPPVPYQTTKKSPV